MISKALAGCVRTCRVQRITDTIARALGGGTGWLHPVSCQSKCPPEHTTCRSDRGTEVCRGDFEGLAGCVRTCRVQRITDTIARALGGGTGWLHPVSCQSKCPPEHTTCRSDRGTEVCRGDFEGLAGCVRTCRVQRITDTIARALGGGTGWLHPVSCQSKCPPEHTTCRSDRGTAVCRGDFEGLAGCVRTCRVQRITDTIARALGGGTGWLHPVSCQSKCPPEHTTCRSDRGTEVCRGDFEGLAGCVRTCRVQRITDTIARALGGGTGWLHPVSCQSKCPPEHTTCRSDRGTEVCRGDFEGLAGCVRTCRVQRITDTIARALGGGTGWLHPVSCQSKCPPEHTTCRSDRGTEVCRGDFEGLAGCVRTCRVQRITDTIARALGGGTGWLHPVSCQSKCPPEHTTCRSDQGLRCAEVMSKALAGCVRTCRVQRITDTIARALGGGTGWLHPVSCQSKCPPEHTTCRSDRGTEVCRGDFEGPCRLCSYVSGSKNHRHHCKGAGWRHWLASSSELSIKVSTRAYHLSKRSGY